MTGITCDLLLSDAMTTKAYELTGLENPNSVSQLKTWLDERGISMDTLGKKNVTEMIGELDKNGVDAEAMDMFKQDMSINCDDLGKLCRAAEDKRYTLRNNAETLQLKDILFQRTRAEMDAYHDMSHKPESWTAEDIERQRIRFCAVWQVIEEAELADEYEAWKEATPNA